MDQFSYLSNAEIAYIDGLYQTYATDRASLEEGWQKFFDGFEFATHEYATKLKPRDLVAGGSAASLDHLSKEINVLNLIGAYRQRGHLYGDVNPIGKPKEPEHGGLTLSAFGLSEKDLDVSFMAGSQIGIGNARLRDIVAHLEKTYCGHIGAEYRYIRNPQMIEWLQARMESSKNTPNYTPEEKKIILTLMARAAQFEEYLQRRMPGQKRFSLEGSEAIIPSLNALIYKASELGVKECVIGMAHRGRLNVLTNIMHKEYDWVFAEFVGKFLANEVFDGDVKYHLGFSTDRKIGENMVHLSLCPNPSHLDAVNPVVTGQARAKMDQKYDGDNNKICPILIHGDASLAGQGVGYEMIQMSRLRGYEVGGAVHIVINNQVGFTTNPTDSRSSTYCTDIAKVTLSPVFHVNGDDPEAVIYTTMLAMEFRQVFKRDVFIDIVSYRRYGHNEGDEPRYTQPLMYAAIDNHPRPYEVYKKYILNEGKIAAEDIDALEAKIKKKLDTEWEESKVNDYSIGTDPGGEWKGMVFYDNHQVETNPETGVSAETLKQLADSFTALPEGYVLHKNIEKVFQQRKDAIHSTNKIDWGLGEHLAFASLLNENKPVRITGQDVERGTFSHRHAVVHDITDDRTYCPLNNLSATQAPLHIYNSLLSEYAVMGFEVGYALASPHTLTIWEAQYGDFMNGAQIIIDQYLTAAKPKWQRMCGLVLLLPHGYEGGGPEHSSARVERFLTLCAENNMYVCNITTPANYFHALRRQLLAPTRRPLVVFSPKSLLRLPEAVSKLEDFTQGTFTEVYDDASVNTKKVRKVVFTFGKLYYELLKKRDAAKIDDIALVRVEQLYPFPEAQLAEIVEKYKKAKEWVWAQEEPENMGGWSFFMRKFRLGPQIKVVARKESASPAVGAGTMHNREQEALVNQALDMVEKPVAVKA